MKVEQNETRVTRKQLERSAASFNGAKKILMLCNRAGMSKNVAAIACSADAVEHLNTVYSF